MQFAFQGRQGYMGSRPTATVIIPSHNRCEDLALTCQNLLNLEPAPEQIVICLDGCTDGSMEMLRRDFPSFQIVEHPLKAGSVGARDKAFRETTTDLIVSLDDDSFPLQKDFLCRVADILHEHPEVGVVTFVELRRNDQPPDVARSPDAPGHYVSTYAGCGAVIRREIYGKVAHYNPFLSHNYEEPDFCVQCYAGGYAVWFEPSIFIRHNFTANQRHVHRGHLLNARNEFLSTFMWCPLPQLAAVAAYRLARQFVHAVTQGGAWVVREPIWWFHALRLLPDALKRRQPIPWRRYFAWMRLARSPVYTINDLKQRFTGSSIGALPPGSRPF